MFKNGTFRPGANLAHLLQNAAKCKLQKGVKENIVQQVRWKGLICNKWKKIQITERAKHCKRLYCEKIMRRFQLETVAPPLIGFTAENFLNQTNQWDLNFQLGVDLTLLRFSAQKENPLPKGNISGR